MKFQKNFKLYILGLFLCFNFLIWYGVLAEERKELIVAFLDVGQGDAIFIEAPSGKQVLIDGGQNRQFISKLSEVMPFYDRSIDMVVLTHPDEDHVGGLPSVLENYTVDFVLEPGVNSDNATYIKFEDLIKEKGIEKVLARQGMSICLDNLPGTKSLSDCGVLLEVLFPNQDASEFDTNLASVVLKLTNGDNSFLFTGDSPKSIDKYLVDVLWDNLDVDVLKLGHHGSKTSNSDLFLGFTSPEYAIASVGLNNSYGHPHKEVLDLLEKFGVNLLRTDEEGTIIFKSDGVSDLKVGSL